jgi:hypothetical protein
LWPADAGGFRKLREDSALPVVRCPSTDPAERNPRNSAGRSTPSATQRSGSLPGQRTTATGKMGGAQSARRLRHALVLVALGSVALGHPRADARRVHLGRHCGVLERGGIRHRAGIASADCLSCLGIARSRRRGLQRCCGVTHCGVFADEQTNAFPSPSMATKRTAQRRGPDPAAGRSTRTSAGACARRGNPSRTKNRLPPSACLA